MLKNKHIIIGLLLVFFVRAGYVLLINYHDKNPTLNKIFITFAPKALRNSKPGKTVNADAVYYDSQAKQFALGNGLLLPKTPEGLIEVVAPGYPVFLGILYFVFGSSFWVSLTAAAILDTLTALLLILLIRQLFNRKINTKIEFLFLLIFACYIPYVVNTIAMATEGLFTFLLVLSFLFYTLFIEKRKMSWLVAAGLVFGFAGLTRPIILAFPAWLLFWSLLFPGDEQRINLVKRYFILGIFLILPILPWTIRNYYHYHKIILVNSNANLAVIGTDTKTSAGEIRKDSARTEVLARVVKKKDEGVFSVYSGIVLNIIKNPVVYVKLFGTKFIRLWFNLGFEGKASPGSLITAFIQAILLALFVISLFVKELRKRFLLVGHAVVYVSFFHIVFFTAKIRFLVPFMPFLLLIAIITILYLIRNTRLDKYFNFKTLNI